MSTFVAPTAVEPTTLYRSSNINNLSDAVATAFALLPSETALDSGTVSLGTCTCAVANTYVVTLTDAPASYTDGFLLCFKAAATNTGASTVNVNGLGVKTLAKHLAGGLSSSDLQANRFYTFRYNLGSDSFELQQAALSEITGNTSISLSASLVDDASPTLGGNLNVSTYAIVDANGNEEITFVATSLAVNHIEIANATSGNGPVVYAVGDSTNIDLGLSAKGVGEIKPVSNVNFLDYILKRPKIRDYSEVVTSVSSSSGTLTVNLEDSNNFTLTLTENITTFDITGWLAGSAQSVTLFITQAASAKTVDWSNEGVLWHDATAPDLSTNSSKHVVVFVSPDGGTTVYGFIASQNAAVPA